jgi:hypothetical protein
MEEMICGPFGEGFRIISNWRWRRVVDMREDRVEYRPCMAGQIEHQLPEFAVEVGEEEESLVAQDREAGIMHRADGIFRFEQLGHHRGEYLRQHLGIGGCLQRKAEREVGLAHQMISFVRFTGTCRIRTSCWRRVRQSYR